MKRSLWDSSFLVRRFLVLFSVFAACFLHHPCSAAPQPQEAPAAFHEKPARFFFIIHIHSSLWLETNAAADTYRWEYDERGNLAAEVDENNRRTAYAYDDQDRLITVTDALGSTATSTYDGNGNLIRATDRRGHSVTTSYDAFDRPLTVTDPDGFTTTTTYDATGNPITITDGNGHTTTYAYDELNRLTHEYPAVGGTIEHDYDENSNRIETTDARGAVTSFSYDVLGRLTGETQAAGTALARTRTTGYDENGNVTSRTNFRGYTTRFAYDALNRLVSETDALNQITAYGYDTVGNRTSITDRRGHSTSYSYDDLNRLVLVTDPLGATLSTTYDAVGNVLTETDKRGITTTHTYDALHRLVTSTRPDGSGATITLIEQGYDREGNITATTDGNGNTITYGYTGRSLRSVQTNPDETTIRTVYDGVGNVTRLIDELSETTVSTYDAGNRLTGVTDPLNQTTSYGYDLNGNRISRTPPTGEEATTTYGYDALNRLISVTDPAGATGYRYDAGDNQTRITDANTHTTQLAYDELDRLISRTQPGDQMTSYTYDEEGNLTATTDANGATTSYSYDSLNREIRRDLTAAATGYYATSAITTAYDDNNNPTRIEEFKQGPDGAVVDLTTMAYDLLDRLTSQAQRGRLVEYSYDANGNRTQVDSPAGTTSYSYDARNRLSTATAGGATTSYSYTADSKIDTISYPNATRMRSTYDAADRLTAVYNERLIVGGDVEPISEFSYTYDAANNRTSQTERQYGFVDGVTETTGYSYDTADRLIAFTITGEDGTTRTTSYEYDGVYNRTRETSTTATVAEPDTSITVSDKRLIYDANNHLTRIDNLLETGEGGEPQPLFSYGYDNNGNTISRTDETATPPITTSFTYDSRNQLTRVIRGPPESGEILGRYDYNHEGLRIRQADSSRGDIDYLYDDTAIIEERELSSGDLIAHYRWGSSLISLSTDTTEHYYHYQALGTTANLSGPDGTSIAAYRTDAWGEITRQEGESPNRQIFTGQEHDENTGLIYFGARFYDPAIGRFITQDPYLGESQTPPSLHRYLYAYGNPTVYVDLFGYESIRVDDESRQVYWNIEKDGFLHNPDTRDVYIGDQDDSGDVILTQEFGGGLVEHERLEKAASMFWRRTSAESIMTPADISGLDEDRQDRLIRGYFESINIRGETRFEDPNAPPVVRPSAPEKAGLYLKKSKNQVLYGDYSEDVTLLGTGVQMLTGVAGVDAPANLRDTIYNIENFKLTKEHISKTAIDTASLLPVVGALRYLDEARAVNKGADDLLVDAYGPLSMNQTIPGQAHHLNQDAAFKSVIPTNEGVSIKLEGNAFTEIGSPHFNAHANLEGFWNQFRHGGARYGEVPTNLEYSKALSGSLRAAGLSPAQVQQAVKASIGQRVGAGQLGGLEVPRVPRRINQASP
jgi:RHS repeat-associated protein